MFPLRQLVLMKYLQISKMSCSLTMRQAALSATLQSRHLTCLNFWRTNCSVQNVSTSLLTKSVIDANATLSGGSKLSDATKESDSLEAVNRIYSSIMKGRNEKNIDIKLLCEEECLKVLSLLIQYKVAESEITHVLSEFPVLLTFSHSTWEETVTQLLKNYRFSPRQILPLVTSTPSVLEGTAWKTMYDIIAMLRCWGIPEGKMQTVIIKHPDLLQTNKKTILNNYTKLCEVFTKSNVISLVLSNPVILTDKWELTYSKISYVCENMGAKTSEILKSQMFKHSLEYIMTRHEFLERAGLYSKPDKHGISKCENAPLRNIMDSDDKAFAKLVAGLTLEEYMVFVNLKNQEFEDAEWENTDSESEHLPE